MSDGVDAVDALDVQVWADLVCPWCYIAQRRLAAAVAGYAGPVAVRHRAYELDPGMPSGERVPSVKMPHASPRRRISRAASRAGWAASAEAGSIGTCPMALRNHASRRPLAPEPR